MPIKFYFHILCTLASNGNDDGDDHNDYDVRTEINNNIRCNKKEKNWLVISTAVGIKLR